MADFNKLGRPIKLLDNANAIVVGSVELPMRGGDGVRFTAVASGGANLTVQCRGSHDGENWHAVGPALVFAADGVQSLWLAEPYSFVRADVTARAAGQVDVDAQIWG
jgi:hypothetical protein